VSDYWVGFCNGATAGILFMLATAYLARWIGGRR